MKRAHFIAALLATIFFSTASSVILGSNFTYQGNLIYNSGPANGLFDLKFVLYDTANDGTGTVLAQVIVEDIQVTNGLFTTQLDFGDAVFSGESVWMEINARLGTSTGGFQQLLPRQEITSAPYAIHSQYIGANSVGAFEIDSSQVQRRVVTSCPSNEYITQINQDGTANCMTASITGQLSLSGNTAGSTAVPPQNNSMISGLVTTPQTNSYGVYGSSTSSGFSNTPEKHSAGVYGQGMGEDYGVKGTAGDTTGLSAPFGLIAVVGIGQGRGVYGSSNSGVGGYFASETNYGSWSTSTQYRGVTGRTARADNNYGLYTPDNLFSQNYTLRGNISKIFKYSGKQTLKKGDIVTFAGVTIDSNKEPLVLLEKLSENPDAEIAGVVLSKFDINSVADVDYEEEKHLNPTPGGEVHSGDYVLVTIKGATEVNLGKAKLRALTAGQLLVNDTNGNIKTVLGTEKNTRTQQIIGIYLGEVSDNKAHTTKSYVYLK